jgi:hypothetical protein
MKQCSCCLDVSGYSARSEGTAQSRRKDVTDSPVGISRQRRLVSCGCGVNIELMRGFVVD